MVVMIITLIPLAPLMILAGPGIVWSDINRSNIYELPKAFLYPVLWYKWGHKMWLRIFCRTQQQIVPWNWKKLGRVVELGRHTRFRP